MDNSDVHYRTIFLLPFLASLLLALLTTKSFASEEEVATTRKNDVIHLHNGNQITGEFKELIQGELKLSTTDIGTIYIKWEAIDWIQSDKYIEFELDDGTRLFGQILGENTEENQWTIYIKTLKDEPYPLDLKSVVRAEQIRVNDSFWNRLDGFAKLGLNYTKASDVLTWNLGAEAKYRTMEHETKLTLDSTLTRKGDGRDTSRHNLIGSRTWFKSHRWFLFSNLGAQQNEELGLDLRVFVAGGAGRFLKRTPKTEFSVLTGLTANKERETGADDNNDELSDQGANIEALFAADYTFFRLYTPKSRINVRTVVYQGLTDTERVRGSANISLRQEFVKDLFLEFSGYIDYDSKPLQGAEATEDFGLVMSVGYEF